jgi:LacI family transcriptional regulator
MLPSVPTVTVNVKEALLGRRAVDQLLWRLLHPDASFERRLIQGSFIAYG